MNGLMKGVKIEPLSVFPDERGVAKKIMTSDEFQLPIRDVYYTSVYKDVVKGWHGYLTKTICFTCVSGHVKFVMYDHRVKSETYGLMDSVIMGDLRYCRVTVPPGIFSAFKGISQFSEVVVVADEPFSEARMVRLPIEDLEYDWRTKNG